MQKLLNPRTLPHFIRNKKNIKFAFGVTMETILRPEGSIFRSTSSFLHTLYPSMLLQKIVMERSDWKKKKKEKIWRDVHPLDEKKVDGCRVVAINSTHMKRSCTFDAFYPLLGIGQPLLHIAAFCLGQRQSSRWSSVLSPKGNVCEWFVTFESSLKHGEIEAGKDKIIDWEWFWEWYSNFEMKICSIVELIIWKYLDQMD